MKTILIPGSVLRRMHVFIDSKEVGSILACTLPVSRLDSSEQFPTLNTEFPSLQRKDSQ